VFFKNQVVSRRGFFIVLVTTVLAVRRGIAEQAHLEVSKVVSNGTNATRVLMRYSPLNTLWRIETSSDLSKTNSWARSINATNIVRGQSQGLGFVRFDIPTSTNSLFVRSVLVTNANITVTTNNYPVPASGETLFMAMENLMLSVPLFTFVKKAPKHPTLGEFILGVNGETEAGGSHWTLDINGKEATVGSSQYVPKIGDEIEWRLENRNN